MKKQRPQTVRDVLLAGEPNNVPNSLDVIFVGEDLEHGRMLVTLIDWADWVKIGWATEVNIPKQDLRKVRDAINTYLKYRCRICGEKKPTKTNCFGCGKILN